MIPPLFTTTDLGNPTLGIMLMVIIIMTVAGLVWYLKWRTVAGIFQQTKLRSDRKTLSHNNFCPTCGRPFDSEPTDSDPISTGTPSDPR